MIFIFAVAIIASLWKPWGTLILYGLFGVISSRGAIVLWRKTKMIYMALFMTIGSIATWVFFVLTLVIPERYESWRQIGPPVAIVLIILYVIERKKNPDKMKRWNSVPQKASFLDLLWFKYIEDLDD
ncbi:hypothetical protein KAW50_02350 [candidate division WOR-3 bacterium]|nr:hypothetical protein [candidate division WOR-3 bacterium]